MRVWRIENGYIVSPDVPLGEVHQQTHTYICVPDDDGSGVPIQTRLGAAVMKCGEKEKANDA